MSNNEITENPAMGDLQKVKSQGRVADDSLGGINLPILMQALQSAAQGEQLAGNKSQQLGLFLKLVNPIIEAGMIQQLIQLTKRAVTSQKQQQAPAQDTGMYNQVEAVDLNALREDEAVQMFMTENPISMAILGQYLEPKDASLVQQALNRMKAGEGIPSNLTGALEKYMAVVNDFLAMGGAGLAKLKSTAKSFLGKDIGKDAQPEPEMEPEMEKESVDLSELLKLAGLYEEAKGKMPSKSEVMKCCKDDMSVAEICKKYPDCDQDKLKEMCKDCKDALKQKEKIEMSEDLGYMQPESQETDGSVEFKQHKSTDKGSVSVEASADDMEELARVMKLAGLELPTMQASADDEEPEQEELLLPQEEEKCDTCGEDADDCECPGHDHDEEEDDAPCGDDMPRSTPKMIMVTPDMDKNAIFNSLKAKLQDKLSS